MADLLLLLSSDKSHYPLGDKCLPPAQASFFRHHPQIRDYFTLGIRDNNTCYSLLLLMISLLSLMTPGLPQLDVLHTNMNLVDSIPSHSPVLPPTMWLCVQVIYPICDLVGLLHRHMVKGILRKLLWVWDCIEKGNTPESRCISALYRNSVTPT